MMMIHILVVLDNGEFYITNFDVNNHYEDNIIRLEKWDGAQDMDGYPLRCRQSRDIHTSSDSRWMPPSAIRISWARMPNCKLILLTDTVYPRIKVTYGGVDAIRPAEEIDAEQFIAQKSFKAKGKRLTTFKIDSIETGANPIPRTSFLRIMMRNRMVLNSENEGENSRS